MAEFEVDPDKLKAQQGYLKEVSGKFIAYKMEIAMVSQGLNGMIGSSYSIISKNLGKSMENLDMFRASADSMQAALTEAAKAYWNTEKEVVRKAAKVFVQYHASASAGNTSISTFADGKKVSAKASASVWNGEAGVNVEDGLFVLDGKSTALGASAEAEAKLEAWKASAKAAVSIAGLNAAIEQTSLWGLQQFKAEGSILSAKADAKTKITLSGIQASASASASAAEGSVEKKIGIESYNVHGKVEGYVAGAKVKAKAGAGIYDKDGKTQVGVYAEAKAEAYLAEGEVKGGITILGIKIDGKAGGGIGIGGEAKAEISGKSFTIGAGIAAGLGLKGEIKVDWSDFRLW